MQKRKLTTAFAVLMVMGFTTGCPDVQDRVESTSRRFAEESSTYQQLQSYSAERYMDTEHPARQFRLWAYTLEALRDSVNKVWGDVSDADAEGIADNRVHLVELEAALSSFLQRETVVEIYAPVWLLTNSRQLYDFRGHARLGFDFWGYYKRDDFNAHDYEGRAHQAYAQLRTLYGRFASKVPDVFGSTPGHETISITLNLNDDLEDTYEDCVDQFANFAWANAWLDEYDYRCVEVAMHTCGHQTDLSCLSMKFVEAALTVGADEYYWGCSEEVQDTDYNGDPVGEPRWVAADWAKRAAPNCVSQDPIYK